MVRTVSIAAADTGIGKTLITATIPPWLDTPVLPVVGLRLGYLNHAQLGARLPGWISNRIDPDMPTIDDNVTCLKRPRGAPNLGKWPTGASLGQVVTCLAAAQASRPGS